ncbi:unnamed protein product [Acanthoscelides obtectus]|nr:unnamed protein product [Acanthoscelides obtectus]CAK1656618.1 hypothetical protein AOBTE_LOCUS19835 [Acanthoscelides obtectus]
MSPVRNMSIMLLTSSTATVLAVTAMILARSVEAKVVRPLNGSQDVTSGPPPLVSGPSGLLSGPPENPEYLKPWEERTERVVENAEELLINECCSRGMILNDTLECETVEKKDEIVAIANSIAVDASMKPAKLNSDQMVLSEYFAHICSGDKSEVVYWPKGGQLKTHYINHKNGELLVVNNTMKKFPSTTYCVDEAKHEGELSYALMMCPCTVSTCIQKCCPETMHFDTIIEQCVPSNPNISTFQPTLQRMMNDTQNEHFFLTYGIPQCKGQLMMLLLNMTKVYPQESGYLMLDDEENGQHQFYERGK